MEPRQDELMTPSIDLDAFDTLVAQSEDGHFASPGATAFAPMDYDSFLNLRHARRVDRSSTLTIPSPDEMSFVLPSSEASSIALSNNSVLCNSPANSDLDFTGVHYMETTTPTTTRDEPTSTPIPVCPSAGRPSRLMELEELHQLRECLMKSSMSAVNEASPSCFMESSLDAEEKEEEEDVSFVGQLPPPQLYRKPSHTPSHAAHPHFVAISGRASMASMLSSTHTLPEELGGVMPMPVAVAPRPVPPPVAAKTASAQMPRESVAALIDAVRASTLQQDDKCRFVFDLFDATKRGVLSREGVAAFVEATLLANNVHCYGDFQVHEMVDKLFAKSPSAHEMTYEQFRRVFGRTIGQPATPTGKGAMHATTTIGTNKPMPPTAAPQVGEQPRRSVHYRAANVGEKKTDFWQRVVVAPYRKYDAEVHWFVFYAVAMIAAFVIKAWHVPYDTAAGYWPRIAKGFAQVITVDACFLLLPMCRNFITYLRRFACVTSRIPIDRHIDFHKISGVVLLLAALGHSVAWFVIVFHLRNVPLELWLQSRFRSRLAFVRDETALQLIQRVPMWTGFAMVLIAALAAPLTLTKIRRGNFNAFWMTHLLFVPFLLLILVHGLAMWVQPPQAYLWILPPLVLYFIEKRYRLSTIMSGGKTSITRVHFSQDTVAIFMKKPENFHFHPGMYLFLNVPVISRLEWHPFTISSAPDDDCLSVHVRNAGDWTGALHRMLMTIKDKRHDAVALDLEADVPENLSPYPSVCIDGPIGAPSQDYYRYKSVVFVGAGIGVTPFASILRSIVHQWQAFRCPCCASVAFPREFQIQKIYFYWVTREQEALTWFTETMNQLAALDTEGRLEIHNYFSPLKRESVVAPLRALQTFIHDVEGQDIISGLATKQVTHFGRPDWKNELQRIAHEQRERIADDRQRKREEQEDSEQLTPRFRFPTPRGAGSAAADATEDVAIFFCGPKPMGRAIHDECATFNQHEREHPTGVTFDFRSEVF